MNSGNRFALLSLVGIAVLVTFARSWPATASASEEETMPFACRITTSSTQWSKRSGTGLMLTITNKSKEAASARVLPSVRLISVPSAAVEPVREFWAPFNLRESRATKDWHDLNLAKGEAIRREIVASDLMWSPVESSVWPGRPFAETVPNGEYRLHVQIDLKEHQQPIVSNDVAVSLSD